MDKRARFFAGEVFQSYGMEFKYEAPSSLLKKNSAGEFEWYDTFYEPGQHYFSLTAPFFHSASHAVLAYERLHFIEKGGIQNG